MEAQSTSTILYFVDGISIGFHNPASDYLQSPIDLTKEHIKHPSSTFLCQVGSVSMKGAGIDDKDLVIIDKSLEAKNNAIAVCFWM